MNDPFLFALSVPGALYALRESTFVGKAVLAILFILSILAWAVMISKFLQVRRARATSAAFLAQLRGERDFRALHRQRLGMEDCPLYAIYDAGCRELEVCAHNRTAQGRKKNHSAAARLSPLDIVHIESALERAVSEQAMSLESQLTLLGTAVAAAPFLGLLGTVWGVMDAFAGIAQMGNTTIGALAPGVSAALITTVTGLSVAIPSMIGYNALTHRIRDLTVQMDNFASEFMTTVRRSSRDEEEEDAE